jgi:beta-xylosidase
MIEAIKLWNEPNNLSHWDFQMDPKWRQFTEMVRLAAIAIRRHSPDLPLVLGGISPIDPTFISLLKSYGLFEHLDAVGVHGFPLDWNHWQINDWPKKLDEIRAVLSLPVWVTEVGVSTFGADEVQVFGLQRTTELLLGEADRVFWYSLLDLPPAWEATTRHKESEGSAYYRHFYLGLIRADGTPKPALNHFNPELGICQWFHFEDHRLDFAVEWLRKLGVRKVRTGISWADWHRPNALAWFDRQMQALEDFDTTITLCFTPPSLGLAPNCTSPPKDLAEFAKFAAAVVQRYVPPPERGLQSAATHNRPKLRDITTTPPGIPAA